MTALENRLRRAAPRNARRTPGVAQDMFMPMLRHSLRITPLLLVALLSSCIGDSTTPVTTGDSDSSGLSFEHSVVSLPAAISDITTCRWTATGQQLLCSAKAEGEIGRQVILLRPDGENVVCVTCGKPGHAEFSPEKVFPFADGKRFLSESITSGETAERDQSTRVFYIGECSPSLAQCTDASFFKLDGVNTLTGLQDREPRLSPDNKHIAWTKVHPFGFWMIMGELARTATGYEVQNSRILNPGPLIPLTDADFRIAGAFCEVKSFRDASHLIFSANRAAGLGLDDFELDLGTGKVRQVTYNLEYEEDLQYFPDSNRFVVGSARERHNVIRTTALIPTAPYYGFAQALAFVGWKLGSEEQRNTLMEVWISSDEDELAGRDGIQVNDDHGEWDARQPAALDPTGSRIAYYERFKPDGGATTRLVVVELEGIEPSTPACSDPEAVSCQAPELAWAPKLSTYVPPLNTGIHIVSGPAGGQAILTFLGNVLLGSFRIDYLNYQTTDGLILNGSEQLTGGFSGPVQRSWQAADITVSGAQAGYLLMSIDWNRQDSCGHVQSQLGERRESLQIGPEGCVP